MARRERLLPWLAVAAIVAFGLWTQRAEARPPIDLNDSGLHLSMARWAASQLRHGANPFDGWYPYLGLGFPQTHHYQSLPHVLTALVGLAVGVEHTYHLSLYLLLSLWPISIYWGGRLLGLSRWQSASAAVVSPLLVSKTSYGYEAGTYTWQGLGIWPQLWAAWLFPITIGLTHRALGGRSNPAWAALALAATIACHFITGWLALALVGLMPLVDWRSLRTRVARMAMVMGGAIALVGWVLLPLWLDGSGANYTGYQRGTFWYDSFGARKILGWLVTGRLLDQGRLPVVTLLAAVGLVVTCVRARDDIAARVVLLLSGFSLVLFFGRPTLGPIADLLPLGHDLFYPRFILGVHLGAILLAGIGLSWLATIVVELLDEVGPARLASAVAAVGCAVFLAPALRERAHYADNGRRLISEQRKADATDGRDLDALLARVRDADGRVYAGSSGSWGHDYTIGYVPVYAELLGHDIDATGFELRVSSTGTIAEEGFDELDGADDAELGVRWLILPADRLPAVPATLVASAGRHRLYEPASPGYGEVVDGTAVVSADAASLRSVTIPASANGDVSSPSRPLIRWHGTAGVPSPGGAGSPGEVKRAVTQPARGVFTFDVQDVRAAYLSVAASWHPRWTATVDGRSAKVVMMAPGTIAVAVPAGAHAVVLRYRPFPWTWLVALAGIALWCALARLTRRR